MSKIPANSGHPLHKGTPRETFVREFLESHLASTVALGTGEIIDCNSQPGSPRNQFDIVIYKRSFPKLDFGGGVSGFLAESVVATIEVKSTLDKAGIEQAVGAARAAKGLQKSEVPLFRMGYAPPGILSIVVAYDGPAQLSTVHGWVKSVYSDRGIAEPTLPAQGFERVPSPALDAVFILGKGHLTYLNAPFALIPAEMRTARPELRWTLAPSESDNLLPLFLMLTVATGSVEASALDPLPYLSSFRLSGVRFVA